ncbi:hypothetical protein L1987_42486 [Smallanthus sonchifolius]|uniref:Uncharacterized protein n=1 Tax=Smallanthus sonchifolius TaxID=185202 RepID=A0ACB9GIX0_9ASTR|nr:hypothetical protein L1987_42486 [Smallanthus sonchifolius]
MPHDIVQLKKDRGCGRHRYVGRGRGKRGGERTNPTTPRRQTWSTATTEPEVEPVNEYVERNENVEEQVVKPQLKNAIDMALVKALDPALPILLSSPDDNEDKDDYDYDYDYESDDSYEARPRKKGITGCPYKAFKDGSPPKFDGMKDAATTHQWIRERSDNVIDKLERNFLRLKAGSMTLLVKTSVPKKYRYVVQLAATMYDKVYDSRLMELKMKWSANSQSQKKQNGGGGKKREITCDSSLCTKCGKLLSGECKFGSNTCYSCGKPGHITTNCSSKSGIRCFKSGELGHRIIECPTLNIKSPAQLQIKDGKEKEVPKALVEVSFP